MLLNLTLNSTTNSTEAALAAAYPRWCEDQQEGIITWTFFCAVTVLLGFPASVAVVWELSKRHRNGTPFTPQDVFMLALTFMDLWIFVSLVPSSINFYMAYSPTYHDFSLFIYIMKLCGRPLIMACSCLDCYLAVVHPLVYRARKSLVPRVAAVFIVWLTSAGFGIVVLVLFHDVTSVGPAVYSWPYVISLPTIAFCDLSILWTLKRSDRGGRDPHPQKKRAHQIIVNSLIMTVIVYLPPAIVLPLLSLTLKNILSPIVISCQVVMAVDVLPTVGSAIMPILHLGNLGKIDHLRQWFLRVFQT